MAAKKIWSIGRDTDCDIVLNSKNVSRKQAEIICEDNVYYLVNHSKHRTSFVEREKSKVQVETHQLQDGDLLYFADLGPFSVPNLLDEDLTVIDFNSYPTKTPTPISGNNHSLNDKIERKRCSVCATVLTTTQDKCHECGSVI